jgi:hypothetical protein
VIGPESIPFVRSTYHTPPEDKPDSVNVTVYFTSENVVESETGVPSTENVDEIGDGAYILFAEAIVYEYDPFVNVNENDEVVIAFELYEVPLLSVTLTYQGAPEGSPVSLNVTV